MCGRRWGSRKRNHPLNVFGCLLWHQCFGLDVALDMPALASLGKRCPAHRFSAGSCTLYSQRPLCSGDQTSWLGVGASWRRTLIQAINLGMSVFLWSEYNFINICAQIIWINRKTVKKVLTITIKIIILSHTIRASSPWYHYRTISDFNSSSIYFCHCNVTFIYQYSQDCLPSSRTFNSHFLLLFFALLWGWRNYQVIFSSSRQGCPTSRPWGGYRLSHQPCQH